MIDQDLFDILGPVLEPLGSTAEEGEEFRTPALDVVRYYRRPARLHWLPWLGRGWGVVAVVRQPFDLGLSTGGGYRTLLNRLALAVNGRFTPGRNGRWGAIGLTAIVLTPEPIQPEEDAVLQKALNSPRRERVVTLGVLRINLGQEAMAMALTSPPADIYPEPLAIADVLTTRFRRFVSLLDA